MIDSRKIEKATQELLLAFGMDLNDDSIKDTQRRVAGYWTELLEGMNGII